MSISSRPARPSSTPWGCRPAAGDSHAVVFFAGQVIFHQIAVEDLQVIRAVARVAARGDDLTAWAVACLTAGASYPAGAVVPCDARPGPRLGDTTPVGRSQVSEGRRIMTSRVDRPR